MEKKILFFSFIYICVFVYVYSDDDIEVVPTEITDLPERTDDAIAAVGNGQVRSKSGSIPFPAELGTYLITPPRIHMYQQHDRP